MPVPNTRVASQHAAQIRFRGVTVATSQRWSPRQTRDMTPVYEINSRTSGKRVEIVPGNVSQLQIDMQRYDLFTKRLHEAFGFPASAIHLADHLNPFDVQEIWELPSGGVIGTIYQGCWFSSIGREFAATGDRVIMVNATIEVTDILHIGT
jgi:hypothetical protein